MELKLSTSLILLISVVMALVLSTVKVLNHEHERGYCDVLSLQL